MDAFRQLFDIAPSTISVHFCLSWAISLAFSKENALLKYVDSKSVGFRS